ncbi:MAG: hypothetical protein LUQ65_05645, partial [Candidatus Helarchaeota archaeon]|nr:hypothetical protein [Candidatus Helarchaeota archaeon]
TGRRPFSCACVSFLKPVYFKRLGSSWHNPIDRRLLALVGWLATLSDDIALPICLPQTGMEQYCANF